MCGLVHVKRIDGKCARKMVEKRYQAQKTRGKEGFGYVAIDDDYVTQFMHATEEKGILAEIEKQSANEILFHHRYPTSTPNYAEAAHPIVVDNPKLKHIYFVAHNGIIYEDGELKAQHNLDGYAYTTELKKLVTYRDKTIDEEVIWNDSEALAIELAIDLDAEQKGIAHVRGTIAFIALQVDRESGKVKKLFFGRNLGSPLKYDKLDGVYLAVTSEGKGETLEPHKLWSIDYDTMVMSSKDYSIGLKSTPAAWNKYNYGGYEYDRHGRIESHEKTIDDAVRDAIGGKGKIGFLPPSSEATKESAHVGHTVFEDGTTDKQLTAVEREDKKEKLRAGRGYDEYFDDYWNCLSELNDAKEILAGWQDNIDGSAEDRTYYEELVIELEADIEMYDDYISSVNPA